jgi:hypothetical protein
MSEPATSELEALQVVKQSATLHQPWAQIELCARIEPFAVSESNCGFATIEPSKREQIRLINGPDLEVLRTLRRFMIRVSYLLLERIVWDVIGLPEF